MAAAVRITIVVAVGKSERTKSPPAMSRRVFCDLLLRPRCGQYQPARTSLLETQSLFVRCRGQGVWDMTRS